MTAKRKLLPSLVFTVGVLVVMGTAQLAGASHPRPKGATPIQVSVVPAYAQCTTPNSSHGAPLAAPSCEPPLQNSNYLTVGTPDAYPGTQANMTGNLRVDVIVGDPGAPDDSDVRVTGGISDVRCKPATDASVCTSPNTAGGPDYSGDLQFDATIRITDHYNGSNLDDAATVQDLPFPVHITCQNTPDTSIGGLCQVPPPSCLGCFFPIPDGNRVVVEVGQIEVKDGGADGNIFTGTLTPFAREGIFIP
jgi:hypothetical protein